ncbi:hypothetical protein SORBI_3010G078000 [Sorghum bicolor]|uniref:Uncharacterized protein n=1 Tax=Sorghum bicolor TaxID=4558 RepID=A0A194YHY9_SORBI|nr:hypothetical protein SORBI_3010G078000 [Sorghum bicolor]
MEPPAPGRGVAASFWSPAGRRRRRRRLRDPLFGSSRRAGPGRSAQPTGTLLLKKKKGPPTTTAFHGQTTKRAIRIRLASHCLRTRWVQKDFLPCSLKNEAFASANTKQHGCVPPTSLLYTIH